MIVLVVLLLLFVFMILGYPHSQKFKHEKYTHRGLHTQNQSVRENSLDAFKQAIEKGYGIELDVQLSKDFEVVVYHDFNLLRLDKLDTKVFDLNLADLNQYNIPTLQEVLDLVDGQVELIIELKADKNRNKLSECVLSILKAYQGPYCVESFDPRIVYYFRKNAPTMKRGQLIMPVQKYDNKVVGFIVNSLLYQFLTRPHFLAINVDNTRVNPMIKLNQLIGVESCLWTVHQNHKTDYGWVDATIFEYFDA